MNCMVSEYARCRCAAGQAAPNRRDRRSQRRSLLMRHAPSERARTSFNGAATESDGAS
ncbi:MAG TPA: hypothetical protein VGS80_19420 [Ktedonobacterales bacterium]|nr:hypothetical protein [Ktedonobacterales bacterium]